MTINFTLLIVKLLEQEEHTCLHGRHLLCVTCGWGPTCSESTQQVIFISAHMFFLAHTTISEQNKRVLVAFP